MKIRLAVLFGGKTVEHEVSVISAIQAIMNLNTEKYDILPIYITKAGDFYIGDDIGNIDAYKDIPSLLSRSARALIIQENGKVFVTPAAQKKFGRTVRHEIDLAFPIVHGTNVEDGALQGYLKTVGIPFVGCDVTASAVGMDKYITKTVLKEAGIPVLDSACYYLSDYADLDSLKSRIMERFGLPVIVKPLNLGSSVGISLAKTESELTHSIDNAFQFASKILIEHAITELREINCSVLGDENEAEASECEEPLHTDEILSYKDKYMNGGGKNGAKGMASVTRKIPAGISPEMREKIRSLSVIAFKTLGCNGVARMDFMIDGVTNELYFNEINTIPGSLSFYLWEPVGVSYHTLLDRMIELALKRARRESSITYAFDTNILQQNAFSGAKGSKGTVHGH